MKVLVLRREFPKTSETFLINELTELEKLGVDFRILAERSLDDLPSTAQFGASFLGKTIYKFKEVDAGDVDRRQLANLLSTGGDSFKPDLIYSPFGSPRYVALASFLSKLLQVPFAVTYRAKEIYEKLDLGSAAVTVRKIRDQHLNSLIREAALVLTTSEFNRQTLKRNQFFRDDIFVYHAGSDSDFFSPGTRDNHSGYQILCVSRFIPKKGIEYLIEACHLLNQKSIKFNLKIAGFGPLENYYINQIKQYNLLDHCEILPARNTDQVRDLLRESSLFVLPSVIDSTGNRDVLATSLQEAMACELAVISTTLPGNEELISHGKDGCLIPPNNAQALAAEIEVLLTDERLRRNLGIEARKKIKEYFSMPREMEKVYREFCRVVSPVVSSGCGDP